MSLGSVIYILLNNTVTEVTTVRKITLLRLMTGEE
jgi:hypothetical protein